MKELRWLLACLGGFLTAADVAAQGVLSLNPYRETGIYFRGSVGYVPRSFALYLPGGMGVDCPPLFPYGGPVLTSRVTVFYAYGVPSPSLAAGMLPALDGRLPPLGTPSPLLAPEEPLSGKPTGVFRPIRPEDRTRALRPAPPEPAPQQKPLDQPEQPRPRPVEQRLPGLPWPKPEADPKAEQARQVALGKQAFAQQAYGLATQHFRQATRTGADEPLPHFLLAQALYALGKYRQAVEAIQAGMRLRPDWPATGFRPKELYDAHAADYAEHLRALDQALADHADDATLLFLAGYQRWFGDRKDEARLLFRRAARVTPDKALLERFL